MGPQDVSSEKGPGPSGGSEEEQWNIFKAEETEVRGSDLQEPLLPAGGPGRPTLHPTTHSLPDASRRTPLRTPPRPVWPQSTCDGFKISLQILRHAWDGEGASDSPSLGYGLTTNE